MIAALVVLSFVLLGQAAAPPPQTPKQLYDRAAKFVEAGSFRFAVGDLNRVLRAEPSNVDALKLRGTAYAKIQEYDKAYEDLSAALKLSPQNPDIYEARADALDAAGRLSESRADRDQAARMRGGVVQTAPPQPPPATPQIAAAITPADPTPVTTAPPPAPIAPPVLKAAPPNPQEAAAHNQRGRELLSQQKFAEAVAELDQAIAAQPDNPLFYNARGYSYLMLRNVNRALVDLDQAIRLNPNYLNAYQNRSAARKVTGDAEGSAADLAKVKALGGK